MTASDAGLLDIGDSKLARALATGTPAFVRRARELELAVDALHAGIARERAARTAILLPTARALVAARRAGGSLSHDVEAALEHVELHPDFARRDGAAPRSATRLVARFRAQLERFAARWQSYLETLPIESIRARQRDYNRYYPIERELALRGVRQPAFTPLALLEHADLVARWPALGPERRDASKSGDDAPAA